jgi:Trk K+ transport system NAD-binding subunit
MRNTPNGFTWRKLRASWRDTLLLMREFRQPLFLFALTIIGSGWFYFILAKDTAQPLRSIVEAIYLALALTFLQPIIDFPEQWYLQAFFFILPVIGTGILALGLADFGSLLFNRRARGKEWEMAVASTFSNHIVLVGLGHLGFRIVKKLTELEQDVVVIELDPQTDLLQNVRAFGVPVIEDDGTRDAVLVAAGIQQAKTIMLCTQDDSLNLRMALKARNLNPKIEVVVRIFDDEFAASLQSQFGFRALSATSMAAPMFAASASDVDITPPITIEGENLILARMLVTGRSKLRAMTVRDLEEKFRVSLVLICRHGQREFHPAGTERIEAGHTLAIFGKPEQINQILHENRS